MIEGSGAGSGSGSIPLTSGSGSASGRPKNMWIRIRIRIRIRNTAATTVVFAKTHFKGTVKWPVCVVLIDRPLNTLQCRGLTGLSIDTTHTGHFTLPLMHIWLNCFLKQLYFLFCFSGLTVIFTVPLMHILPNCFLQQLYFLFCFSGLTVTVSQNLLALEKNL